MLHALLIGIDGYVLDRLPGGASYPSLRGATRDVERMESFLRDRAGLTPERTRKLLSGGGKNGRPAGPPEQMPTYTNIVAAFKQLAFEAAPGDRVCVHYSGHGTRLKTDYQEIKGSAGQDEALVPCDIGAPSSRYLRDVELAVLVRLLVDQGLLVTLVLDCCHAGGALRDGRIHRNGIPEGAVARRVPEVHLAPVPSAVAPREVLMRAWKSLQQEVEWKRSLSVQSVLPVTQFVLFAACLPEERAYEYPFENGEPQGVLTYWLLETLRQSGPEQRCEAIYERLVVSIYGGPKKQTPLFVGDGDRLFLGEVPAAPRVHPSVPKGPMVFRATEDGRVLLSWGQAQGGRERDRLILKVPGGQQRMLEVDKVGPTESLAKVVGGPKTLTIPPGTSVEVVPLQGAVRLLPPERGGSAAQQALTKLREALWRYRGGFVEIDDEAGTPDLCVAFTRGSYEIRDPDGSTFPNLLPLRAGGEAADQVVRQLDHLSKYQSLRMVENPKAPDWLEIGLELCNGDPSADPVPFPSDGLDLPCGEEASLRIINRSSLCLDFAVLALGPDYSVKQLLPSPQRRFSSPPLDPGEGRVLPMQAWLPDELQEGVHLLKIFATGRAVSFRWLELPALGKPVRVLRGVGIPSKFPEKEWISRQVEIRVRR